MNSDLVDRLRLKAKLLTSGCAVDPALRLPRNVHRKRVHLYAHSPWQADYEIPDDVLLSGDPPLICRLRFDPSSPLRLEQVDGDFVVVDSSCGTVHSIGLPQRPRFWADDATAGQVGRLFSFLGTDVLGLTPSNYCFYFSDRTQCRFCEIVPAFKRQAEYRRAVKPIAEINTGLASAMSAEASIRHFAVTSGNWTSYDATARLYIDIIDAVAPILGEHRIEDVLATLMPPDDWALIPALKAHGYTKIYFPLEVFRTDLFEAMCPGKHAYGHARMLKALDVALDAFGPGNVYTNFVYGLQSLSANLDPTSHDPERENEVALAATDALASRGVIPAFTIYHYGGSNQLGRISLQSGPTADFFEEWGRRMLRSGLLPECKTSVLFGSLSLSNTLFNDGFLIAKHQRSPSI